MKPGRLLPETRHPFRAQQFFRAALAVDPVHPGAWLGLVRSSDAIGQQSGTDDLIRELEIDEPLPAERIGEFQKDTISLEAGR